MAKCLLHKRLFGSVSRGASSLTGGWVCHVMCDWIRVTFIFILTVRQ
jgi:hypothetical protein